MVDTMIWYNITILPCCSFCVTFCVLHTPDLTPPDMTGYTLDSMAGAWPQLAGEVYSSWAPILLTWVFPSVRAVLSITFIPGFVMIMD